MELEHISELLSNLEKRVSTLEEKISNAAPDAMVKIGGKPMSVKEFILSKKLMSAVEKTLVIGFYIEHIEKNDMFNIDDLANYFKLAREKVPVNLSDTINKNINKGHFMVLSEKKDQKKALRLTSSGETYVEKNLNK